MVEARGASLGSLRFSDFSDSGLTDCQSVENCYFIEVLGSPVRQLCARFRAHLACDRACCTISTRTFRVPAGSRTSCGKAIRAPRMLSGVVKRT
jgi:hypothetical protein